MVYHVFNLRFWLSVWRKWRNLNSVITTSGTLNVRIGKYKQTTVFENDTVTFVRRHLCDVYSANFFLFYMLDPTVMQTIYRFRVSCLWCNMAGTKVKIFVTSYSYSPSHELLLWYGKITTVATPNKKALYIVTSDCASNAGNIFIWWINLER